MRGGLDVGDGVDVEVRSDHADPAVLATAARGPGRRPRPAPCGVPPSTAASTDRRRAAAAAVDAGLASSGSAGICGQVGEVGDQPRRPRRRTSGSSSVCPSGAATTTLTLGLVEGVDRRRGTARPGGRRPSPTGCRGSRRRRSSAWTWWRRRCRRRPWRRARRRGRAASAGRRSCRVGRAGWPWWGLLDGGCGGGGQARRSRASREGRRRTASTSGALGRAGRRGSSRASVEDGEHDPHEQPGPARRRSPPLPVEHEQLAKSSVTCSNRSWAAAKQPRVGGEHPARRAPAPRGRDRLTSRTCATEHAEVVEELARAGRRRGRRSTTSGSSPGPRRGRRRPCRGSS